RCVRTRNVIHEQTDHGLRIHDPSVASARSVTGAAGFRPAASHQVRTEKIIHHPSESRMPLIKKRFCRSALKIGRKRRLFEGKLVFSLKVFLKMTKPVGL